MASVFGRARVGQADVGVERGDLALGIGGVVGDVGLVDAVERGAADLLAADQGLLLGERGAIPELDDHPDDAHHLVRPAGGPRRLPVVPADGPHVAVHQLGLGRRGWPCRRRSPAGCAAIPWSCRWDPSAG